MSKRRWLPNSFKSKTKQNSSRERISSIYNSFDVDFTKGTQRNRKKSIAKSEVALMVDPLHKNVDDKLPFSFMVASNDENSKDVSNLKDLLEEAFSKLPNNDSEIGSEFFSHLVSKGCVVDYGFIHIGYSPTTKFKFVLRPLNVEEGMKLNTGFEIVRSNGNASTDFQTKIKSSAWISSYYVSVASEKFPVIATFKSYLDGYDATFKYYSTDWNPQSKQGWSTSLQPLPEIFNSQLKTPVTKSLFLGIMIAYKKLTVIISYSGITLLDNNWLVSITPIKTTSFRLRTKDCNIPLLTTGVYGKTNLTEHTLERSLSINTPNIIITPVDDELKPLALGTSLCVGFDIKPYEGDVAPRDVIYDWAKALYLPCTKPALQKCFKTLTLNMMTHY